MFWRVKNKVIVRTESLPRPYLLLNEVAIKLYTIQKPNTSKDANKNVYQLTFHTKVDPQKAKPEKRIIQIATTITRLFQ